jgi:deferrochelatase/peroxidase EfeB
MSDFQYNDLEGTPDLGERALRNLQCNILRSTRRIACDHVFHRFLSKPAFVEWLKTAPSPSFAEATDPDLVNILLTHEGLNRLGLPDELLNQMDPAFRRGTRNPRTSELLSDPMAAAFWEDPHRLDWHVIELHWRSSGEKPIEAASKSSEHVVRIERGHSIGRDGMPLKQEGAPNYNHFGIEDGVSNPVYTSRDYEAVLEKRGPSPDAGWKWDPRAKLSTLLVPDPLANHHDCFGSYFVFRKFGQNVARFRQRLADIAKNLIATRGKGWWWKQYPALDELDDKALGALIDRISSDQPIHDALSNKAGIVLAQLIFGVGPDGQRPTGGTDNNFDYADDPGGKVCPFSAHARACNARGSRLASLFERKTIVARRGISYKEGLFFWCAQASIGEQFEYIQERWANASNVNPDHQPTPGVDYLIGRTDAPQAEFSLDVHDTVTLQASEYLFAPSIMGFQRLRAVGGAQ